MICNCHQVSETALVEAIEAGADSVAALGQTTKAGTGCGSCKGELEELLKARAKPARALPVVAATG
jgi:NAD(P)H-nitrite reductase large subunit